MSDDLRLDSMPSESVGFDVPYAVLTPEADPEGRLILLLHGGGSSRDELVAWAPVIERRWARGWLPPAVVACASTAIQGFYIDFPGGEQWGSFIMSDFVEFLRREFSVGTEREKTAVMGISMGGFGALKLGFGHPDVFGAVVALEPAIVPSSDVEGLTNRNLRFDIDAYRVLGIAPPNGEHFRQNNPATMLEANQAAIRIHQPAVFLEAGTIDGVNLHDGTEYLHRLMWHLDIPHEYYLGLNAGHLGPSLGRRFSAGLDFIARTWRHETDDTEIEDLRPDELSWVERFPASMTEGIPGDPREGRQNHILRVTMRRVATEMFGLDDVHAERTLYPTAGTGFGPTG